MPDFFHECQKLSRNTKNRIENRNKKFDKLKISGEKLYIRQKVCKVIIFTNVKNRLGTQAKGFLTNISVNYRKIKKIELLPHADLPWNIVIQIFRCLRAVNFSKCIKPPQKSIKTEIAEDKIY